MMDVQEVIPFRESASALFGGGKPLFSGDDVVRPSNLSVALSDFPSSLSASRAARLKPIGSAILRCDASRSGNSD